MDENVLRHVYGFSSLPTFQMYEVAPGELGTRFRLPGLYVSESARSLASRHRV